jgi:hypothetical protein
VGHNWKNPRISASAIAPCVKNELTYAASFPI